MSIARSFLVSATGALALLVAPLAVFPVQDLPAGYAAFAEKGGNGNGGGGGNDGGNGGGGGGGGSESSGNAGGNGNGNGGGNGGGGSNGNGANATSTGGEKSTKSAKAEIAATSKAAKTKNLNAQLAGLNSLKRNVNGLMNSADPRMEGIRAYVEASAALELAEQDLEAKQLVFDEAAAAFAAAAEAAGLVSYDGSYAYDDLTLDTLETRLTELQGVVIDPTDPDAATLQEALDTEIATLSALLGSQEATELGTAETELALAEQAVIDAQAGTTDADLTAALLEAANDNRVAEYTDEDIAAILAWAKEQLAGTVEDYLAQ